MIPFLLSASLPSDIVVFERIFGSPPSLPLAKSFSSFTVLTDDPCWNDSCDYERFFQDEHGSAALIEAKRTDAKFGQAWSPNFYFNLLLRLAMDDLSDERFLEILKEFRLVYPPEKADFGNGLLAFIQFRQIMPECKTGAVSSIIRLLLGLSLSQTFPDFWRHLPRPMCIPIAYLTGEGEHWFQRSIAVYRHLGGDRMEPLVKAPNIVACLSLLIVKEEKCPINFIEHFMSKRAFLMQAKGHFDGTTFASEKWFKAAESLAKASSRLASVMTQYAFRYPFLTNVVEVIMEKPTLHRYMCNIAGVTVECSTINLLTRFIPSDTFTDEQSRLEVLNKFIEIYPEFAKLARELKVYSEAIEASKPVSIEYDSLIQHRDLWTMSSLIEMLNNPVTLLEGKLGCLRGCIAAIKDYTEKVTPLLPVLHIRQQLGLSFNDLKVELFLKEELFSLLSLSREEVDHLWEKYGPEIQWFKEDSTMLVKLIRPDPLLIKTTLLLEGGVNPFMQVTREQIYREFDIPIDAALLAHWFGHEECKFVSTNGMLPESPIHFIIGNLWALKNNMPSDCPITQDDIDDLLKLSLNFYVSARASLNQQLIGKMRVKDVLFLSASREGKSCLARIIRKEEDFYAVTLFDTEVHDSSLTDLQSQVEEVDYMRNSHGLVRWYLSGSPLADSLKYAWWKTWMFIHNLNVIKSSLGKIKMPVDGPRNIKQLIESWKQPTKPVFLSSIIIQHQLSSLKQEGAKYSTVISDSINRMLDEVDY